MADRERPVGTPGGASARSAFSVVLPAFDEEHGLLATLEGLRDVLGRSDRAYEIIVVNDGSTDATPRLLAACADVTVIHHGHNRGYGAALKAGIRAAHHPLVVVMDADGTYPAAAIPTLVDQCDTADMVVGARIGRNVHSTPARSVAKWCFRQFAEWITRTRIPDLNSGLRAFHRAVAERFMDVLPDGFSFTTTITIASILERFVVRFEAVDYMPRIGRSKVRPVRDTLRIARQLLRLGLRFAPFRTSVSIALPLLVASAVVSAYHLLTPGHVGAADLASPTAGVLMLAIGLAAEQRVRRRRCLTAGHFVTSRGSLGA
jgi:glycosyltransferase involved in cell wall biosynthesis